MDYLQNVLLIVFEVFCCKIFYETFGEKRYKGWVNVIQIFLLSGYSFLVAYALANHFIARQITIYALAYKN